MPGAQPQTVEGTIAHLEPMQVALMWNRWYARVPEAVHQKKKVKVVAVEPVP